MIAFQLNCQCLKCQALQPALESSFGVTFVTENMLMYVQNTRIKQHFLFNLLDYSDKSF